jgi:hypothetical protein
MKTSVTRQITWEFELKDGDWPPLPKEYTTQTLRPRLITWHRHTEDGGMLRSAINVAGPRVLAGGREGLSIVERIYSLSHCPDWLIDAVTKAEADVDFEVR